MKELLEFLIEKCQNGLKEAAEKCVDTKLKGELEKIGVDLKSNEKSIVSSPSPGKTKDVLYELISMLTDITMSHKHPAQIFCVPLQIRSRRQTRRNLRDIKIHLENPGVSEESLNGKKEEDGPSETFSQRWICKILPCLKRSLGQGTEKSSSNENGGLVSAEPVGEGTSVNNSSSSGGKEVCSGPEGLPAIDKKILGFDGLIKKIKNGDDDAKSIRFKTRTGLSVQNGRGHVEIGIVGMCGSGKTTLAQSVYLDDDVAKDFEPRIWVTLPHIPASKQRDFNQILKVILEQCGDGVYKSAMDAYTTPQLLRTIRKNMLGKKYLLVLDGLWDADIEWYFQLSRALDWQYKYGDFGDDGSESAVIITSRLEEVAKTMVGISGLHQINPLLDEETCWSIFINKLESLKESLGADDDEPMKEIAQSSEIQDDDDPKKEVVKLRAEEIAELIGKIEDDDELKKEIKKQCDGLPLAAVTLAEIIAKLIIPHK